MNGELAPFALYLHSTLMGLWRHTQTPVRSRLLADHAAIPLSTAQWYLARLERQGMVTRRTPKTGWLPA